MPAIPLRSRRRPNRTPAPAPARRPARPHRLAATVDLDDLDRYRRAAGAELGKPVGICGEAAADPLLAVVLVGLGATSLSMSPSALADVRASLARYTREDAERIARAALAAEGAAEAKQAAQEAADASAPTTGTTVP